MRSHTLAVVTLSIGGLVALSAGALVDRFVFHDQWRHTAVIGAFFVPFVVIPLVAAYLRVFKPRRRSALQTLVFVCTPLLIAALVYLGWYLGYPKAVGIISFIVLTGVSVYYFLGAWLGECGSQQDAGPEKKPEDAGQQV